jgi:biopolymer transport protein ExbB/TolQ
MGGFFGVATSRMRTRAELRPLLKKGDGAPLSVGNLQAKATGKELLSVYIRRLLSFKGSSARREHVLTEFELEAAALTEKSKIVMRVGPMLGLMGTLIPMGPALAGLASGELGMMAHNMQIAFATTVIGVFCGVVGFVLNTIERRWYAQDLADLAWIQEALPDEQ